MFGGCDHICIPKKSTSTDGKNRVCKCGIGYDLKKPQQVGCYARIQNPPYLVFADVDHGLIFQMSLEKETGEEAELQSLRYVFWSKFCKINCPEMSVFFLTKETNRKSLKFVLALELFVIFCVKERHFVKM